MVEISSIIIEKNIYFCYLNPEAETMKKNYLKIIVTIAAMIPCLSACNKYHEGKLVEVLSIDGNKLIVKEIK